MIDMYPLDFEEFLWANGIGQTVIDSVKSCFENEKAVPDGIHKVMMEMLYRYVIVGGLPEVVNCFLKTRNIELIYKLQRNLIAGYEEDMVKYAEDADKPNIRECFDSIPKQLAKENKKFQYSVVKREEGLLNTSAVFSGWKMQGLSVDAITHRLRNCR